METHTGGPPSQQPNIWDQFGTGGLYLRASLFAPQHQRPPHQQQPAGAPQYPQTQLLAPYPQAQSASACWRGIGMSDTWKGVLCCVVPQSIETSCRRTPCTQIPQCGTDSPISRRSSKIFNSCRPTIPCRQQTWQRRRSSSLSASGSGEATPTMPELLSSGFWRPRSRVHRPMGLRALRRPLGPPWATRSSRCFCTSRNSQHHSRCPCCPRRPPLPR